MMDWFMVNIHYFFIPFDNIKYFLYYIAIDVIRIWTYSAWNNAIFLLKNVKNFLYEIDIINWFMLKFGYFMNFFVFFNFFVKFRELVHINLNRANSDWNNIIFFVEASNKNFCMKYKFRNDLLNYIQRNMWKQILNWKELN